ncbi:efflux RND transporter periplasmic adaptor subunit [Roseibium sp. M-1]
MRKAFWVLLALGAVGLLLSEVEDTADVAASHQTAVLQPVAFTTAITGSHAGAVSVFAEVAPRWQVELQARVTGIVSGEVPLALAGTRVVAGTVLLKLENAPYRANLAEARSSLESARLELLQKEKKRDIALKDWRAVRPGIEPPDLAIHLPEVRVAEEAVAAARTRLEAAEYDLASTELKAPFHAIVARRQVSPGQNINAGESLFSLLDDSKLDIQVSVNEREWALMNRDWQSVEAVLLNESGDRAGTARVTRGGGFLDPQSRKYQIFLEVEKDRSSGILPGQFVRVDLPGAPVSGTLQIPESALTQDGFVWFIDMDDRLRRFEARALFHNNGRVIVEVPEELRRTQDFRIVTLPMNAYLPGQKVAPVEGEIAK